MILLELDHREVARLLEAVEDAWAHDGADADADMELLDYLAAYLRVALAEGSA